jgi:uncharacterized membrane protein YsdA (DUF1294 family)/cold shock CspA family protein
MAKPADGKLLTTEQRGVVVKFDAGKGYGFIRPTNGSGDARDVFVHVHDVDGRRKLVPGQNVRYYVTRTDKGVAAVKVRPGSALGTPYIKYSIIGFGAALILLLVAGILLNTALSPGLWLALWVAALSIASLGVYGYDKAQAQSGGTRVPEVVLHALSAAGGSPGSFVAMRLFRHKTAKRNFQIVFWLIAAVQVTLLAWVFLKP